MCIRLLTVLYFTVAALLGGVYWRSAWIEKASLSHPTAAKGMADWQKY